MLPVFVRKGGEEAQSFLPTELPDLAPEDELGSSPEGPFAPARDALLEDTSLREQLLFALFPERIKRFAIVRPFVWASLLPVLALVELDRELASFEGPGAYARAFIGLLTVVWAARELVRPLPRYTFALAALVLGSGIRIGTLSIARCHPSIVPVAATIVSLAAAIALVRFAPGRISSAQAIADHVRAPDHARERLSIPRALFIAVLLPLILFFANILGLWVQAAVFVLYAIFATLGWRMTHPPFSRMTIERACAAFVLTLGLATSGHHFAQAVAALARCFHHAFTLSTTPLRFAHPVTTADRILLVVMTIAIVPLAEERIFRGVLQSALRSHFGPRIAIGLSSIAFGVAHLGVYGSALWQAILLGIGFGVAFEEGGLACAAIVHAAWNAYLLF